MCQGHVNNAAYIRYAESARVNWISHFAIRDPGHRDAWRDLMKPKSIGLIMKSIKADYKFVSAPPPSLRPVPFFLCAFYSYPPLSTSAIEISSSIGDREATRIPANAARHQPMTAPDRISVYHKLSTLPESTHTSLLLDCIILSHGHRRAAARTTEDIAIYDYREAKKTVLPDFMLDVLRDTWRQQEERAEWARGRIWDLLREVELLEKETWDREGAVEDSGTAGR